MVIITNGTNAVMYYSESQWLDASDEAFPTEDWGFRVPNSTKDSEILGTPATIDPQTGEVQPGTPPMTQAAVEAIATEVIFEPAAPEAIGE
jgi:hypothetical protein